jgi:hypothetical protein
MRIMNTLVLAVTLLAAGSSLTTPASAGERGRYARGTYDQRYGYDRGRYGARYGDWRGGGFRDESCGRSYHYHDVFNGWDNSHISAFKDHYLRCGDGRSWIQKVDNASGCVIANYAWDPRCQGWRTLCDAEVRDLAYGGPQRGYDAPYGYGQVSYRDRRW